MKSKVEPKSSPGPGTEVNEVFIIIQIWEKRSWEPVFHLVYISVGFTHGQSVCWRSGSVAIIHPWFQNVPFPDCRSQLFAFWWWTRCYRRVSGAFRIRHTPTCVDTKQHNMETKRIQRRVAHQLVNRDQKPLLFMYAAHRRACAFPFNELVFSGLSMCHSMTTCDWTVHYTSDSSYRTCSCSSVHVVLLVGVTTGK